MFYCKFYGAEEYLFASGFLCLLGRTPVSPFTDSIFYATFFRLGVLMTDRRESRNILLSAFGNDEGVSFTSSQGDYLIASGKTVDELIARCGVRKPEEASLSL